LVRSGWEDRAEEGMNPKGAVLAGVARFPLDPDQRDGRRGHHDPAHLRFK
jgi:hypothetical protein